MILRILALLIVFNSFGGLDPLKTRNANLAKERAENAIAANDFKTAIQAYNYLLDTLKVKDDKALLNLAHAHMRKADYNNAISRYTEATKSADNKIKSIASQQLGVLQSERGNREEAQAHFKNAIKYDPSNTQARFNYELMLKNKNKEVPKSEDQKQRKEEEKKNQEKKDQQKKEDQKQNQDKKSEQDNKEQGKGDKKDEGEKNKGEKESKEGKEGEKDEQKKNEEGKSDKNKEGEDKKEEDKESDKKPDDKNKSSKNKEDQDSKEKGKADKPSEKGDDKKKTETPNVTANKEQLQKMNMTEHQAKAILNAMRQGEVQYIQQMKRGGKNKNDKPKKDW